MILQFHTRTLEYYVYTYQVYRSLAYVCEWVVICFEWTYTIKWSSG